MLHLVLMTCRRVAERATDFHEGVLGPVDRLRLRFHLAICRTCTRYLKQLELTKHACSALKDERCSVASDTKAKLLEAFRSMNKS